MIYTCSISEFTKFSKQNKINPNEVYLITRSDKLKNSAINNGWNYCNELAPSWDLYNSIQEIKKKGEWNKEKFESYYVPNFYKCLVQNYVSKQILSNIVNYLSKDNENNIYLLCYCKDNEMCHRTLVAKLLSKSTGIGIIEIGGN